MGSLINSVFRNSVKQLTGPTLGPHFMGAIQFRQTEKDASDSK
jgi:hypothetical protein